jgi:hypothetical protein
MRKYLISGLTLGVAIPHYLSNYHFEIMQSCLYQPHVQFYKIKKEHYKLDKALDHTNYLNYILDITKSFYQFIHFFTIGERREFRKMKQKMSFDLIENFEFVRETLDNFDFVIENMRKLEEESLKNQPGSYAFFQQLEEEAKQRNKTADDYSIENIQIIKEMAEDDYEKYLLENSVMRKEDYDKSLTPEFKLQKEANRLRMIEQYQDAQRKFKSEQMGDDLQAKQIEFRQRTGQLALEKSKDEEMKTEQQVKERKELNIKEKPDLSKKYPTVKSVEPDIEALKQLFGTKK